MKKRRFTITQDDADLVVAALDVVINELDKDVHDLMPREIIQLANCKILRNKLTTYQWEV